MMLCDEMERLAPAAQAQRYAGERSRRRQVEEKSMRPLLRAASEYAIAVKENA